MAVKALSGTFVSLSPYGTPEGGTLPPLKPGGSAVLQNDAGSKLTIAVDDSGRTTMYSNGDEFQVALNLLAIE
jgi:hypothetical protein